MESPVRICLGAALVVHLLLLCGTAVSGVALPLNLTTTVKDERAPRHGRVNNTLLPQPKSPDDSLNELNPKETTAEEHTDKNAKYKDRGRVRYQALLKSSTESPLRRVRSTEGSKLEIVTPTAETKKPAEIIDSMRTFKKTKLPVISSSTTPVAVHHKDDDSDEDTYDDEEDEDEKDEFGKFSSNKYDFTIPTYGDDFSHDSDNENSDNKEKHDYGRPTYGGFSSLFPEESPYGYKDTTHDIFKSESFFSFDSDLTTPKNDFFDKKYQSITNSIINKLDTIKTSAPQNSTNTNVHKIVQENVDTEKVGNNTPSNKSSVFIKNTKEIRLLDNDGASSANNKELSDVHGTSIYYEMSVLSTETYNINTDDDCDNDSLPAEPTVGTSSEEELGSTKTRKQVKLVATLPTIIDSTLKKFEKSLHDSKTDGVKHTSTNLKYTSEKSILPDGIESVANLTFSSTSETVKADNETTVPLIKLERTKSRYDRVKTTSPGVTTKLTTAKLKFENVEPSSTVQTGSSTLERNKYDVENSKFDGLRAASTISPTYPTSPFDDIKPTYSDSTYQLIKSNFPDPTFETVRPTFPDPVFETIKPLFDSNPEKVSIETTNFALSSQSPAFNTDSTVNIIPSTDRTTKTFSNSFTRNRSYSKRLNLNGNKESLNSVNSKPETSTQNTRTLTRKFHFSTPRTKPVWMAPRRNGTKPYVRPTYPTTIYSEHFNIKDKLKNKLTTTRPRPSYKTVLTTISSDIDPVLQNDIGGTKKTVQSQSVVDNTIPSLWKRGSTKFASSTITSEEETEEGEWQIPPTSTAWALASLRSPPPTPKTNGTSVQDNLDENELQKVGEVTDKKRIQIEVKSDITTTSNPISNDIIPTKIIEVDQNKLPSSPNSESHTEAQNEIKSERIPAESNVSVQSSAEPATTKTYSEVNKGTEMSWVPVTFDIETTERQNVIDVNKNLSTNKTRLHGFESITKLPSSVTTPRDESIAGSEVNQTVVEEKPKTTTDYEITTIRFSYIPTNKLETKTPSAEDTPSTWHPVFPTRTTITTNTDDPITTYRPTYTTETNEETTTIIAETTSSLEVSSQALENAAKLVPLTTETTISEITTNSLPSTTEATFEPTNSEPISQTTTSKFTTVQPTASEMTTSSTTETTIYPTTTTAATGSTTNELTTQPTTMYVPTTTIPTTTEEVEDTTTIVVEVVTEINTEREQIITSTTALPVTTETPPSELHDTDCTDDTDTTTPETRTTEVAITTDSVIITTGSAKPVTIPSSTTIRTTTEIDEETTIIQVKMSDSTTEKTEQTNAKIKETTFETTTDSDYVTKSVGDLEDTTGYAGEVTTKASSITFNEEDSGSGAAIAIAVSTIGVIALILLIGLLLVVRRRGRRGVYAQRCTPVSLDAYSLDSVSVGHRKGNHRLRASKRSYGNPAYDDEVTSHPMQYAALANFALDVDSMSAEFTEIPSVTVRPEEVPPGCEEKNRYSNVLPLPETRVPLKRIGNDPTTEYINANYITGPGNIQNYYIACQAPLSNTVVDFWRMVWEQNSRLIVMLTEYMENGVEKCFEYLPPSEISDNKRTFGDFKIILKKREQRDKYAVSSVQLINMTTRTWREITHLWYFWPAKGVPDDYDSVIDFLCEMRSYMKISQTAKEYDEEGVEVIYGDQSRSSFSNLSKLREESGAGVGVNVYSPARAEENLRRVAPSNGTLGRLKAASEVEGIRPCVMTCASGAGRAAALVALDICARALPAGADVPRVVRHLRAQRPHSLSNRHHYIFVYKVLSEYGHKMLGGGVDTI